MVLECAWWSPWSCWNLVKRRRTSSKARPNRLCLTTFILQQLRDDIRGGWGVKAVSAVRRRHCSRVFLTSQRYQWFTSAQQAINFCCCLSAEKLCTTMTMWIGSSVGTLNLKVFWSPSSDTYKTVLKEVDTSRKTSRLSRCFNLVRTSASQHNWICSVVQ